MSKAAHNGCQARADIPTGLGMHQESTFAMSRLRHKRAVRKILPASVWVWSFAALGCKLNSFQFYGASKVAKSSVRAMTFQSFWWDLCWHISLERHVWILTEKLLLLV